MPVPSMSSGRLRTRPEGTLGPLLEEGGLLVAGAGEGAPTREGQAGAREVQLEVLPFHPGQVGAQAIACGGFHEVEGRQEALGTGAPAVLEGVPAQELAHEGEGIGFPEGLLQGAQHGAGIEGQEGDGDLLEKGPLGYGACNVSRIG